MPSILEDAENGVTDRFRVALAALYMELAGLDERVRGVTGKITRICVSNPCCRRLAAVEGIGPIISPAIIGLF